MIQSDVHLFGLGILSASGFDLPEIEGEVKTCKAKCGVSIKKKDYQAKLILVNYYNRYFFRFNPKEFLEWTEKSVVDTKIPLKYCRAHDYIFEKISKKEFLAIIEMYRNDREIYS